VKVTIDSSEPLEDALRVLGALYQVTVVVDSSGDTGASPAPGAGGSVTATSRTARPGATAAARPKGAARRRKRGRARSEPVSNADLRAWAREQGYAVADRGRLPGEILRAYQDAHRN
jgi:hypothetical protein